MKTFAGKLIVCVIVCMFFGAIMPPVLAIEMRIIKPIPIGPVAPANSGGGGSSGGGSSGSGGGSSESGSSMSMYNPSAQAIADLGSLTSSLTVNPLPQPPASMLSRQTSDVVSTDFQPSDQVTTLETLHPSDYVNPLPINSAVPSDVFTQPRFKPQDSVGVPLIPVSVKINGKEFLTEYSGSAESILNKYRSENDIPTNPEDLMKDFDPSKGLSKFSPKFSGFSYYGSDEAFGYDYNQFGFGGISRGSGMSFSSYSDGGGTIIDEVNADSAGVGGEISDSYKSGRATAMEASFAISQAVLTSEAPLGPSTGKLIDGASSTGYGSAVMIGMFVQALEGLGHDPVDDLTPTGGSAVERATQLIQQAASQLPSSVWDRYTDPTLWNPNQGDDTGNRHFERYMDSFARYMETHKGLLTAGSSGGGFDVNGVGDWDPLAKMNAKMNAIEEQIKNSGFNTYIAWSDMPDYIKTHGKPIAESTVY